MLKSFRVRLIVILAALGMSIWNYADRGLKLGLDLQGGMHLVLEVDDPDGTLTPDRREEHIDQAMRIIRTRIDEFGVEEPIIQKIGRDRIVVELAGLDDESRAKEVINQQAFLEWKLVLPTAEIDQQLDRLDRAVVAAVGEEGLREMGRAVEETESSTPIEQLLFSDPSDAASAEDDPSGPGGQAGADDPEAAGEDPAPGGGARASADPADQDAATPEDGEINLRPFTSLLNKDQAVDDDVYLVDAEQDVADATHFMSLPEFQRAMPRGVSLQWGWDSIPRGGRAYRELYVLQEEAFLTGDQLDDATANRDQQFNQPQVLFELSRTGGRAFQRLTSAHIGDRIAIVLDDEVVSAPVVRDRIGARGTIEMGAGDMSDATDLALVLRAGALPVPLAIMEERAVGPSLGQTSVNQGRTAGIVGVIAVMVIMILYYKVAGVLAVVALGFYLMLVLGGLAALDATLTLPGIAGLILSIGMAVDANVLIFERIREELERRRAPRTAVDEGFSNAVSAIVDANITTLITGLILFQFGTGPVRGFAVTLCIGIVASFFSALYVTRTLFLMYLSRKRASDPVSI